MTDAPRIALFADTFYEVNGAARTCREWNAFAQRRRLPFFCIRWARHAAACDQGENWSLDLERSSFSFPLDPDLSFDLRFSRHLEKIESYLHRFRPDFIHVTSPGDLGILGSIIAARFHVPLAASWHTNVHEFAARRVGRFCPFAASSVERFTMSRLCWFFGRAQLLFAPNPELAALLRERTGRPVVPMGRGIDTELFHPSRRARADSHVVLAFVGRLMPEKNLRLLPAVADALRDVGIQNFRFQISGAGSERTWLERHLPNATFTGVLRGEELAKAYADADIFVFPSRTDTFGNVIQEALASGTPAVVMNEGGPRFIVRHGVTGIVAATDEEFCRAAAKLAANPQQRREMGRAGRLQVEFQSWDRVFEEVYEGYAVPAGAF